MNRIFCKTKKLLAALPVAVNDFQGEDRDYMWVYIKAKMIDYTIQRPSNGGDFGSKTVPAFGILKLIKENLAVGYWINPPEK